VRLSGAIERERIRIGGIGRNRRVGKRSVVVQVDLLIAGSKRVDGTRCLRQGTGSGHSITKSTAQPGLNGATMPLFEWREDTPSHCLSEVLADGDFGSV
jgi:hypothetical protein